MGGFAETLLLKSGIPVLVVPSAPGDRAQKNQTLDATGSEMESESLRGLDVKDAQTRD